MSRFYDLSLINAQGQLLASTSAGFVPSTTGLPTFSSRIRQAGGVPVNNPGALNIEFDIPIAGFALPQGNAWVRISGVGLKTIGQAANLNANPAAGIGPTTFILSAGMIKGLPLANPLQAGVIAQGQVFAAYGQWQGTEQSLDLTLIAAGLTPASLASQVNGDSTPNGIKFNWLPGQTLAAALKNCFAVAFPDLTTTNSNGSSTITILTGLVQSQSSQNVSGWYESLSQFASYILDLTRSLGAALTGNNSYPGVIIGIRGNTIFATDATQSPKGIALSFQDLIGQPTWISPNTINFKCVLRADIQIGDMVSMPPDPGSGGTSIISSLALTQQGAAVPGAPSRNSSVFKGAFMVVEVHHFANLRQPDGDSWATAFSAVIVGPSASP
jgi:hypothetical protein